MKKLRGRSSNVMGSAGMTGKSSGLGKCVMPNVCHRTTSVFSRFAVGLASIQAGMPWEGSPEVWGTWRPAGWSWASSSRRCCQLGETGNDKNCIFGLTFCNVHGVTSETCTLPHKTSRLREQLWNFPADQLVTCRLLAVRIDLAFVTHIPRPARCAIVIRCCLLRCAELCLFRIKCISVLVFGAADLTIAPRCIYHEYSVVWSVNVRVDAQTEKVLVVVCIDARVDLCTPALEVFTREHGVSVQNASELDFELDGAVKVENPVDAVFIVGSSEDVRDDKLASASDCYTVVAEIGVLEQDPSVFLMDADSVLDGRGLSGAVNERRIHVVDGALAVTA